MRLFPFILFGSLLSLFSCQCEQKNKEPEKIVIAGHGSGNWIIKKILNENPLLLNSFIFDEKIEAKLDSLQIGTLNLKQKPQRYLRVFLTLSCNKKIPENVDIIKLKDWFGGANFLIRDINSKSGRVAHSFLQKRDIKYLGLKKEENLNSIKNAFYEGNYDCFLWLKRPWFKSKKIFFHYSLSKYPDANLKIPVFIEKNIVNDSRVLGLLKLLEKGN